ncbi:MAG: hypothetical protein ABW179_09325 [Methylobacterium sp.]|jgi:hypothetical protein
MIDDDGPPTAPYPLDHTEWIAYLRLIRSDLEALSPSAAQCVEWAEVILRRETATRTRPSSASGPVALRQ